MSDWVVVGIGTADRADDAVGLRVADRVQELSPDGLTVVPVATPLDLLDVFDRFDRVVVVDAVRSGAAAGAVSVRALDASPLPALPPSAGTHGVGVAQVVELARALDRLPAQLVVVGVELAEVTAGGAVSPAVAGAVDRAVAAVLRATSA